MDNSFFGRKYSGSEDLNQTSEFEPFPTLKKTTMVSSTNPTHIRLTQQEEASLTRKGSRKNTAMLRSFNLLDKDKHEKDNVEKIMESLNVLNIFKEKMSQMMKNYDSIFSSLFENHVSNLKKQISQRIDDFGRETTYSTDSPLKSQLYDRYTTKKVMEKLESFFEFHTQLNYTLQKNLDLVKNFLQSYDFSNDSPIEEFVSNASNDIYESWIFNNINFEKLKINRLIENENFPNVMKRYIFQDTSNKFKNIVVKKMKNGEKNLDFDIALIKENTDILEKLVLKSIETNDLKYILKKLSHSKVSLLNLHIVKVLNSNLQSHEHKIEKVSQPLFEHLQKLVFKNNLMNFNFVDSYFHSLTSIKQLTFYRCSLCSLFTNKIYSLLKDITNLEKLDLSHNYFTDFNLENFQHYNSLVFPHLEYLNLRHNNLSSIRINKYFPNLRILDLTFNNFVNSKYIIDLEEQYKNLAIVFSNRNVYLNIANSSETYKSYILSSLQKIDISGFKKLDLSFVGFSSKNGQNCFEDFTLHKNIMISLKKINFTACNMTTALLNSFFQYNNKLIHLKTLILKDNFIKDDFLEMFLSQPGTQCLENLTNLDLSNNLLEKTTSLIIIHSLIISKKYLKNIKLSFNQIEILFNNYILIISSNNKADYEDVNVLRLFLSSMRNMTKKNVCISFSKMTEKNVSEFLKVNHLEKMFNFE